MYFNSGYLNNSRLDFKDYSKPLVVGSCGTYRLKKRPKLPTFLATRVFICWTGCLHEIRIQQGVHFFFALRGGLFHGTAAADH